MKKQELREHIIKIASELFYVNGYNATGINEIISKSGIAKATLYSHFNSKDELCIAYLRHKNSEFMQGLDTYLNTKKDVKEQLLSIFDYLRELYYQEGFNGCWGINCLAEINSKDIKIREEIQAQKSQLIAYLAKIIDSHYPLNSIAETDRVASGIYLLYESAICESHLHKNDWPIFSSKRIAKELLPKT